jgi:hypothetical protein
VPPVSLHDFPSASTCKTDVRAGAFANRLGSGETYKVTKAGLGPADTNVVLCTLSRECLCVLARNTSRVEEVVVVTVLELVRAFLAVVESSVPGDLVGSCAANFEGSVHRDLEDIAPEGAKVHVVLATNADPGGIDTVVVLVCRETNGTMVSPATGLHSFGCCDTDL